MPKPFDATLKDLVSAYPQDWAAHLGLPAATPVEVIDADLSAVTAGADRVLRVLEPSPWLLHLEFQASRDNGLPLRVLKYNRKVSGNIQHVFADGAALPAGVGNAVAARSTSNERIIDLPGDLG